MLLLNRSERPSERAPPVVGKINIKLTDRMHLIEDSSENFLEKKNCTFFIVKLTKRKNTSIKAPI